MILKQITFTSSNTEHDIYAYIWQEESVPPKGVLQIVHGMSEHMGRYDEFARFMAKRGFIVCGNDLAGHGKSLNQNKLQGYFGKKEGHTHTTLDIYTLTRIMRKKYGRLPYFLLGHSMGSFFARDYTAKYGRELNGVLYSGTCGKYYSALLGIIACRCVMPFFGGKEKAHLIYQFDFNRKRGSDDTSWLTRDEAYVQKFTNDKSSGFRFTYSGYLDLLKTLYAVNKNKWFANVPKDLPIYMFSGEADPVGNYGKGVLKIYRKLQKNGCDVTLRMYQNARHEMLNELNKIEVYVHVYKWLLSKLPETKAGESL